MAAAAGAAAKTQSLSMINLREINLGFEIEMILLGHHFLLLFLAWNSMGVFLNNPGKNIENERII
jgi:hypothetical protein